MTKDRLFNTRITELFNIKTPIIASGLQWLSNADYVAAAAHADIIGFITAASFNNVNELRDEIRRCQALCEQRPFGVNISMLPKLANDTRIDAVIDLVCSENVRFVETSGRSPAAYLPRLHNAGIKVLHKVPTLRHARSAQACGVDAITIVGAECGGHPGNDLVGTVVQATLAAQDIYLPLVVAGGIGNGAQMLAALALGADGVGIGTRFLVAEEIPAHIKYKMQLIKAAETDTCLVMQSINNSVRCLNNETAKVVAKIEQNSNASIETLMPYISGKIGQQSYRTGNIEQGILALGQSVVFAKQIEPLADIIKTIEKEAIDAYQRLQKLQTLNI